MSNKIHASYIIYTRINSCHICCGSYLLFVAIKIQEKCTSKLGTYRYGDMMLQNPVESTKIHYEHFFLNTFSSHQLLYNHFKRNPWTFCHSDHTRRYFVNSFPAAQISHPYEQNEKKKANEVKKHSSKYYLNI